MRAARGGSRVALALWCGFQDAPSISDLGLRVGAVWGFARSGRRLVERAGLTGVLRDRGATRHPRPGGKIFILFPVISSVRQITFIRKTGPGENFCPQFRFRFSGSPGYRSIPNISYVCSLLL